jgi:hypothetical protein
MKPLPATSSHDFARFFNAKTELEKKLELLIHDKLKESVKSIEDLESMLFALRELQTQNTGFADDSVKRNVLGSLKANLYSLGKV